MATVRVLDKRFETLITEEEILKEIDRVARQINTDLYGSNVVFVCVLNGAFMFAADLMKRVDIECEICFVKLSSYEGFSSSGTVKELIGLNVDVKGKTVVLVEDIVETGTTIFHLKEQLRRLGAAEVRTATMLFKPEALRQDVKLEYVVKEIGKEFVVGYGLDYNGKGRNLRDIYAFKS